MLRKAGVSGHAYPVGVHQPRLLVHPWPRSPLPRLQLLNANVKRRVRRCARGGKKYPRKFLWIPLRLSQSDTPPFFFLGKIFWIWEEGGWQTVSLSLSIFAFPLSLARSSNWFRWNLIWIAAFDSGHSCAARRSSRKRQWASKAPNLIKSGTRGAPLMKTPRINSRSWRAGTRPTCLRPFGTQTTNCYCFACVW